MRRALLMGALLLFILLAISACKEPVCEVDEDCVRDHYTGVCENDNCTFTPIPNECGNDRCEAGANENTCTCPEDCGICEGPVAGSQYLTRSCDAINECTVDLDVSDQVSDSHSLVGHVSSGDRFTVISRYPNPFNLRKDALHLSIFLQGKLDSNKDHVVKSITLTARSRETRQLIPLVPFLTVDQPITGVGPANGIELEVPFSIPTPKQEEEIFDISMEILYEYVSVTPSGEQPLTRTIINRFTNKDLIYVNPTATYANQ